MRCSKRNDQDIERGLWGILTVAVSIWTVAICVRMQVGYAADKDWQEGAPAAPP